MKILFKDSQAWQFLIIPEYTDYGKNNGSPSKNPDNKTPLVASFFMAIITHFSPLAAFWCRSSSKNFRYLLYKATNVIFVQFSDEIQDEFSDPDFCGDGL